MRRTVLVPVREEIIQMVLDGERRPSCCCKGEWDVARALVKHYGKSALSRLYFSSREELAGETPTDEPLYKQVADDLRDVNPVQSGVGRQ